MSQIKRIFKNMSWLMISQIIACICGFIWTIIIARSLGVNEYGILGFATSLTGILSFTMDWGIGTHIVRHIATDYDSAPKYLGNALPLKSLFACGTMILTLIILMFMKSDELTVTITLLFSIEMVLKSFMGLLHGSFQAFEEGKFQGIANTILNVLLLVFILLSVFSNLGIYGITVSYIVANAIALGYSYHVLTKHITKPKYEFDRTFCKTIMIASIPFSIGGILYTIYYSIDTVMLTQLVGSYQTGIYNATYKLIAVLTLFYSVYNAVIFPVMSKFFKNDEKLLIVSFEKSIKYLMTIIIPIAISTMIYSADIITLFYGHEYDSASSVLSILIWTVCLLFANGACNSLLLASHKEVTTSKIYAVAAVFNITLNLIMIPHYLSNGAAITTVLSDLLILIIFMSVIYKMGYKINKNLYVDLLKIIIASVIFGIILYTLNLNMWMSIPTGIIIYLILIVALKLVDENDKYILKEILGKN